MSLDEETDVLQRKLRELASNADSELTGRYLLERPPMPPGIYWRLRWLAGSLLRWLQEHGVWRRIAWPVSLKQHPSSPNAKPLLIWAVGAHRDTLREACTGLSDRWGAFPGFAPVLITDIAEFAFFSRLGWLVEYLPPLAGQGEPYAERKLKFLARLYRGAPVLPVSAGLEVGGESQLRR